MMLLVSTLKRVTMAINFPRLLLRFQILFITANLSRVISCPPAPVAERWVRIRGHGILSFVSVVCRPVEVCAMN
jgi:hypothetical protein